MAFFCIAPSNVIASLPTIAISIVILALKGDSDTFSFFCFHLQQQERVTTIEGNNYSK
jgi:hypothetical protein